MADAKTDIQLWIFFFPLSEGSDVMNDVTLSCLGVTLA